MDNTVFHLAPEHTASSSGGKWRRVGAQSGNRVVSAVAIRP